MEAVKSHRQWERKVTYKQLLDAWDSAADAIERDPNRPIRYGKCYRYLRSLDNSVRILEVGCGEGTGLVIARSLGISKVVGIDVSGERLKRAKQKLGVQAALVAISPDSRLPFRTASFDVVVSAAVIEHVLDPKEFVRELCRVVRPDGHLAISSDCWQWRILQILGAYKSVQPIDKAPFPTSLFRIFKACNLRLLHYEGFSRPGGDYCFLRTLRQFYEAKPVTRQLIQLGRLFKRAVVKMCRICRIISPIPPPVRKIADKPDFESFKAILNEPVVSRPRVASFLKLLFADENVFFLKRKSS
jgi:SAM-dependent methyltransferase